jgi:hypothetical protein
MFGASGGGGGSSNASGKRSYSKGQNLSGSKHKNSLKREKSLELVGGAMAANAIVDTAFASASTALGCVGDDYGRAVGNVSPMGGMMVTDGSLDSPSRVRKPMRY